MNLTTHVKVRERHTLVKGKQAPVLREWLRKLMRKVRMGCDRTGRNDATALRDNLNR